VLARQPAGPEDLVAPSMRAGEAPASRHLFSLAPLMGPFAERAASLQADASAAADAAAAAARAAVQASKARIEARSSKSSKNSLEGGGKAVQSAPRRALLQDINTEAVLTALIILIFDFFLGFYTGKMTKACLCCFVLPAR
jgi:hypothetical protein